VTSDTIAGLGIAAGVALTAIGIYLVVPGRSPRATRLLPMPLAIPTGHGTALGAGLHGVSF
jgi:hypothetical protein